MNNLQEMDKKIIGVLKRKPAHDFLILAQVKAGARYYFSEAGVNSSLGKLMELKFIKRGQGGLVTLTGFGKQAFKSQNGQGRPGDLSRAL